MRRPVLRRSSWAFAIRFRETRMASANTIILVMRSEQSQRLLKSKGCPLFQI